jgi:3-oxoacyl-[acyl-carrier-protein] synthase II
MTSPSGEGGKQAMELALQDAGLLPEQIGYINTHATSTRIGDLEEARSIAALFPEARKHLHLSATKSMTGHLLGAAGSLEAFFSIMAIQENKIPPTINLDSLDSECAALGLNFTPHKAIEKRLNYTLSNSFGFGGTNATLIFGRV